MKVDPTSSYTQSLLDEAEHMRTQLLENYWDPHSHFFSDRGMVYKTPDQQKQNGNHKNDDGGNTDGEKNGEKNGEMEVGFECHIGYVTLLPFALQLMDVEDPRVGDVLDAIEDPERVGFEGI